MYRKSDSDDAEAIALATLNMLDKLPDACPNDAYWSLGQLVHRRDNIMKQRTRLVNQLHEQLCIAYPSYKSFFNDISRPTALYFWEHYPSKKYLKGKSVEETDDCRPINQYHLWNVKERYGVPHAGSGKCWRKVVEQMSNQAMGLLETPDGYVWHHLDDYNVEKNTITMELVMDEAHNASKPHSGGCAQYDSVNGPTYNKKRR